MPRWPCLSRKCAQSRRNSASIGACPCSRAARMSLRCEAKRRRGARSINISVASVRCRAWCSSKTPACRSRSSGPLIAPVKASMSRTREVNSSRRVSIHSPNVSPGCWARSASHLPVRRVRATAANCDALRRSSLGACRTRRRRLRPVSRSTSPPIELLTNCVGNPQRRSISHSNETLNSGRP